MALSRKTQPDRPIWPVAPDAGAGTARTGTGTATGHQAVSSASGGGQQAAATTRTRRLRRLRGLRRRGARRGVPQKPGRGPRPGDAKAIALNRVPMPPRRVSVSRATAASMASAWDGLALRFSRSALSVRPSPSRKSR